MTTAVIIPGFREQVYSGSSAWRYAGLVRFLKDKGFTVVVVKPTWSRRVIQDWVAEAGQQINGVDPKQTVIIGFSFGAMIAAGLATQHAFGKVVLCSLSPYFAEDVAHAKPWWLKVVGTARAKAFTTYRFADIAKNWKAKRTAVMLGTLEISRRKVPRMELRGREAAKLLPSTHFVPVPYAGHDIAHANYAALIEAEATT